MVYALLQNQSYYWLRGFILRDPWMKKPWEISTHRDGHGPPSLGNWNETHVGFGIPRTKISRTEHGSYYGLWSTGCYGIWSIRPVLIFCRLISSLVSTWLLRLTIVVNRRIHGWSTTSVANWPFQCNEDPVPRYETCKCLHLSTSQFRPFLSTHINSIYI